MTTVCDIDTLAPNAPDLVLDLLGAALQPLSGHAICHAGQVMGLKPTAMRVALTRLVAEQKVTRLRRGVYRLRPDGVTLAHALDRWNAEAGSETPWQDHWVAVHDTHVPRSDKTAWRHHQLALTMRGFAAFSHGLHLRPDNRPGGVDAERERLRQLGLSPRATVFQVSHLSGPDARAARALWPTQALDARYRALRSALQAHQRQLARLPIEQALRETLLLGRTAMAQLARDPMLPPALMHPRHRDALRAMTQTYRATGHALWSGWIQSLPTP